MRNDSGDPLIAIADLSTMWLKALVPENQIPSVRIGQEVEVTITALPGCVFKARINAIEASGIIEDSGFTTYDDLVHGYGGGYPDDRGGSRSPQPAMAGGGRGDLDDDIPF